MDYLNNIIDSLSQSVGGNLSSVIAAVLILFLGWIISSILKDIIVKLVRKTGVDDKLKGSSMSISKFIGKLVYFIIMIFVFMLALEKLGMSSVLDPVKNMLGEFMGFIPNIIGAGLVGYIGYMLATVVSELVELSGTTIQSIAPKLKLPENINLVAILKKLVFIFIFIPLLIAALNILNMDAISQPATAMLSDFFSAIPKVLVAALILIIFVVGARFISGLVKDLLNTMNLNNFFDKAGLDEIVGDNNITELIGKLVYFFIVLFGLMTAVDKLEFSQLSEIMYMVSGYAGKILFGLVILAIGSWIANLASSTFAKRDDNTFVASIIKVAVFSIFLAMGLKSMGIADDIINLAFGISLATVALTIILSFGLGGREAAGKQMDKILKKFNNKV